MGFIFLVLFSFCVGGAALFTLICLLMFTIGGPTGVIHGNAVSDISSRDTYYVVARLHIVLSLGSVIAIFPGIMYRRGGYQESLQLLRRASDIVDYDVPWYSLKFYPYSFPMS